MGLQRSVIDAIEKLGVSQASKILGVSAGTASNWKNGKTSPSIDAAETLLSMKDLILPDSVGPDAGTVVSEWGKSYREDELFLWEGRKVHVLLPVYRSIMPWTHYSLFANYAKYGPDRLGMSMEIGTQIHEARNRLVHKARKTEAEQFIFIDDDVVPPCGNAAIMNGNLRANIPEPGASFVGISRLMSHPPEMRIVGGLYFGRHEYGAAQTSDGFGENANAENDRYRRHAYDAIRPQKWVAPGFMRIHRSVFDDLDKAIAEGMFQDCIPNGEGRPVGYFNPIRSGMGEDVSFGVRCTEIGIVSYVDPVMECLHSDGPFSHYGGHNTKNKPQ